MNSALKNQADLGFAKWKAVSDDGEFLGWAGFTPVSETSEISMNYCLPNDVLEQDPGLPNRLVGALVKWFFTNTYFSHLMPSCGQTTGMSGKWSRTQGSITGKAR